MISGISPFYNTDIYLDGVNSMKKALTIAGSDSSGGAGIQADLKSFSANGVFGLSIITAVTAQNTQGVLAIQDLNPEIIAKQMEAIFEDIEVDAVKIGMVSQVTTIEIISEKLKKYQVENIVVDPVMVSKSGFHLLNFDAESKLKSLLIPLAILVTPNIFEAEAITGRKISSLDDMEEAARFIQALGPKNVLLKGGKWEKNATDVLYDGSAFQHLVSPHIVTNNTHGTGCTLSSAIAAYIARGSNVGDAVVAAKEYVNVAIKHGFAIGKGDVGPTHHFYDLYQKAGVFLND